MSKLLTGLELRGWWPARDQGGQRLLLPLLERRLSALFLRGHRALEVGIACMEDALLFWLPIEVGMQVVPLLLLRFVLFDRHAVGVGPPVLPDACELPADFHPGLASGDGKAIVLQLLCDIDGSIAPQTSQLVADIGVERLEPGGQMHLGLSVGIQRHHAIVEVLHVGRLDKRVGQVLVGRVQRVVDLEAAPVLQQRAMHHDLAGKLPCVAVGSAGAADDAGAAAGGAVDADAAVALAGDSDVAAAVAGDADVEVALAGDAVATGALAVDAAAALAHAPDADAAAALAGDADVAGALSPDGDAAGALAGDAGAALALAVDAAAAFAHAPDADAAAALAPDADEAIALAVDGGIVVASGIEANAEVTAGVHSVGAIGADGPDSGHGSLGAATGTRAAFPRQAAFGSQRLLQGSHSSGQRFEGRVIRGRTHGLLLSSCESGQIPSVHRLARMVSASVRIGGRHLTRASARLPAASLGS
jgi:hypothetical protein